MHLCLSRHTWLHAVASEVLPDLAGENLVVIDRVRAGTDQRHCTAQHVKELWQLVEADTMPDRAIARLSSMAGVPTITKEDTTTRRLAPWSP